MWILTWSRVLPVFRVRDVAMFLFSLKRALWATLVRRSPPDASVIIVDIAPWSSATLLWLLTFVFVLRSTWDDCGNQGVFSRRLGGCGVWGLGVEVPTLRSELDRHKEM